jgi:hypothetical protein
MNVPDFLSHITGGFLWPRGVHAAHTNDSTSRQYLATLPKRLVPEIFRITPLETDSFREFPFGTYDMRRRHSL